MIPWTFVGFCLSDRLSLLAVLSHYAALLSLGFLSFSIGLLVSAYPAGGAAGSSFNLAGVAAGLSAFYGLVKFIYNTDPAWNGPIVYLGFNWPPLELLCLSAMALWPWAFLAAKWRIGSDLREGRRIWRLPAFLAFLVVYQAGFPAMDIYLSAILPAFIAFFAATLNSERREHWRRWLSGGGHWLHDVPTWIAACASYGILAPLLVLIGKASGSESPFWRYPIIQTCFLARDCSIIQVCRFTAMRRPEITALILIGLAYLLPSIVVITADFYEPLHLMFLFGPFVVEEAGTFFNILPGVVQAAGALWLLFFSIRRQRLTESYPEL